MRLEVLDENAIGDTLLDGFDRRQVVTRRVCLRDGTFSEEEAHFTETWDDEAKRVRARRLRAIAASGGWVCVARDGDRVVGLTALAAGMMASQPVPTLLLTTLHVSAGVRHQGLGTRLFCQALKEAAARGAARVYVSACSAVETQAFYRACGCVPADTPDAAHSAEEPWDIQMIRPLSGELPLSVLFPPEVPDEAIRFSVVLASEDGVPLLCRHHARDTWECPGGHREAGESPEACARRELWEETGAEAFTLTAVGPYVVAEGDRESAGMLYVADVTRRGTLPPLEIAECRAFSQPPRRWTYPQIQPRLLRRAGIALPSFASFR